MKNERPVTDAGDYLVSEFHGCELELLGNM